MSSKSNLAIPVLEECLRPLAKHYLDPEVEEIAVCCPGEIHRRLRSPDRTGRIWQQVSDPRLEHDYLLDVAHMVACLFGQPFDGETVPTLSGTIPGRHRFTCVAGSQVMHGDPLPEGGIAMNIRQAANDDTRRSLEDFGLRPGDAAPQQRSPLGRIRSKAPESAYRQVRNAVASGHPLVLSGATGSGKTTLLNRLLEDVDLHDRVITVEDTRELNVRNPNRVHLLISRDAADAKDDPKGMTTRRLMDVMMRLTPDTIVVGEISTSNAGLALEIMGSGHAHCWTSLHAGSPDEAIEIFATRVRHTDQLRPKAELMEEIASKVCVIQTERRGSKRSVVAVRTPEDPFPSLGASAQQGST